MIGSDIISVYKQGADVSVVDRFVPWAAFPYDGSPGPYPVMDVYNNWKLISISARLADGVQVELCAVVRRALNSLDPQDRVFDSGSMPIIYAWGYTETYSDSIAYHGDNRGTTHISFINSDIRRPLVPVTDTEVQFVYGPSLITRGVETQHVCQSFDFGEEIRHITAINVLPGDGNLDVNNY